MKFLWRAKQFLLAVSVCLQVWL